MVEFVADCEKFAAVFLDLFFEHCFEVVGDLFGYYFAAVFDDEYEVVC